jgi:hypothetical protein
VAVAVPEAVWPVVPAFAGSAKLIFPVVLFVQYLRWCCLLKPSVHSEAVPGVGVEADDDPAVSFPEELASGFVQLVLPLALFFQYIRWCFSLKPSTQSDISGFMLVE